MAILFIEVSIDVTRCRRAGASRRLLKPRCRLLLVSQRADFDAPDVIAGHAAGFRRDSAT